MNDLTFLDEELAGEYGASDAILKAVLPGGRVIHISDAVSPFRFLDVCPLLYHAFEYNSQSRLQASIDASSETAVISLARYCYTGSYLAAEPDGESILLLQHAETYKIAEDFDQAALQAMAHGNFSCQVEFACSLPDPPKDLLDTIRFVYRHFASDEARREHNLVETLLNYCVGAYISHKLGENSDFLTAVREISAFRQDLCRTNIARNFEDDCAADIIRLPSGPAMSSNIPTLLASRELPSEMLYDLPRAPVPTVRFQLDHSYMAGNCSTLPYRRGGSSAQTYRQRIPDRSKHCVSPSALAAALEKHSAAISETDSEGTDHAEDALRKYKRARIQEASAQLEGWPLVSENSTTEQNPDRNTADEDAYWASAFGHPGEQFRPIPAIYSNHPRLYDTRPKPAPQSACPLPAILHPPTTTLRLQHNNSNPDQFATSSRQPPIILPPPVGYERRNLDRAQPATWSREHSNILRPSMRYEYTTSNPQELATSSPHKADIADTRTSPTLPLQPRGPEIPSLALAADSASEDEGFAIIPRAPAAGSIPHSRMSSPELVVVESIAKAEASELGSESEWSVLDKDDDDTT